MKKTTFLKTLLMAVGLCMGTSAWGAKSNLNPTGTTQLHAGEPDVVKYDGGASSWTCTLSSQTSKRFKNDNSKYGGSFVVITKFDAASTLNEKILVGAKLKFHSVCTDADKTKSSAVRVWSIGTNWTASTATWNNTNTDEIIAGSIIHTTASIGTSGSDIEVDVKDLLEADGDKVVGFGFSTVTGRVQSISNIVLEVEYSDASSVTTYSIEKYTVGGTLISSEEGLDGIVGETASAESSEGTFYSLDTNTKYVFDSENTNNVVSMTLTSTAASNVLKLYFNEYSKYNAKIVSVCGSNVIADITGSWYADETPVTLYWPKAVSTGEGYYVVDAEESTPYYGHTFSTSNLTKTVTYTLDESIVYYTEYENILTDKNSYEYFPAQSSKGTSRCIQKSGVMKTAMGLASTGVYDVIIAGGNRDGNHTLDFNLKLIDSEDNVSVENVITNTFTGGQWGGELTAEKVTIPAGSELYLANDNESGNARFAGDYIIVRKSYVPATIGATGYSTFSSTYALDFTDVEDLEAYTATACNGSYVTMSKVTGTVAANTGLVLIGESADIPVVASGDTQSGNLLVDCSTNTEITPSATGTNYVLSVQDEKVVFAPVTSDNATVTAGHAFLYVPSSAGARTLSIVFADDETTSISDASRLMDNGEMKNDNFFNLNGQRVEKPAKGLYIVNGKKVVMK